MFCDCWLRFSSQGRASGDGVVSWQHQFFPGSQVKQNALKISISKVLLRTMLLLHNPFPFQLGEWKGNQLQLLSFARIIRVLWSQCFAHIMRVLSLYSTKDSEVRDESPARPSSSRPEKHPKPSSVPWKPLRFCRMPSKFIFNVVVGRWN